MEIPDDQWLSKLKESLREEPLFQAAMEACRQLEAKGCDPRVIQGYLGRIAGYKPGNLGARMHGGPNSQEIARRIRGIAHQIRKLAKRTEALRVIWGFRSHMIDADCFHVPEELEDIAQRLSGVSTKGFREWNPQREAILDLLDHVRSSTGRYHYAEVSTLINAELSWRALKHERRPPDLRYDVDSLKMMVQRWKKDSAVRTTNPQNPGKGSSGKSVPD